MLASAAAPRFMIIAALIATVGVVGINGQPQPSRVQAGEPQPSRVHDGNPMPSLVPAGQPMPSHQY